MNSEVWLNEMVWDGSVGYVKRRAVVWQFTKYGLIPFLKAYGYILHVDEKELSTGIASLLFHNWGHSLLTPVAVHRCDDYSVEHREHYNHVIDPTAWESFWTQWNWWEDVSLESERGFYRRLDIQEYCWSQLDISSSPQTRIVEEHMAGDEPHVHHGREEYDEY
jgi:hypothetical protein